MRLFITAQHDPVRWQLNSRYRFFMQARLFEGWGRTNLRRRLNVIGPFDPAMQATAAIDARPTVGMSVTIENATPIILQRKSGRAC
jgi:hypothetical protein